MSISPGFTAVEIVSSCMSISGSRLGRRGRGLPVRGSRITC